MGRIVAKVAVSKAIYSIDKPLSLIHILKTPCEGNACGGAERSRKGSFQFLWKLF